MGPVFLVNGRGGLAGLDMNFNGWGNKQVHPNDARIAREVLALLGVPPVRRPVRRRGRGAGVRRAGTVMATGARSSTPTGTPASPRHADRARSASHLGARKMVWVRGCGATTSPTITSTAWPGASAGPRRGRSAGQPAREKRLGRLRTAGTANPAALDRRGRVGAALRHLPGVERRSRRTRTPTCSSTSTSTGTCATAP